MLFCRNRRLANADPSKETYLLLDSRADPFVGIRPMRESAENCGTSPAWLNRSSSLLKSAFRTREPKHAHWRITFMADPRCNYCDQALPPAGKVR
jgi:hypothetical protein